MKDDDDADQQNEKLENSKISNNDNSDSSDDTDKMEAENQKILRSGRVVVMKQSKKNIKGQIVHQTSIENDNQKSLIEEKQKGCFISTVPSNLNTSDLALFAQQPEKSIITLPLPTNEQQQQDEESMETEDLEFIIIQSESEGKTENKRARNDADDASSSKIDEVTIIV